jgi:hypothetical protein
MATPTELMTARIFLKALFPVMKVVIEDDPKMKAKFKTVTGKVQFVARDPAGDVGACLHFEQGRLEIVQGVCPGPDITFGFPSVARMNAMLAGKPVIPRIRGLLNISLLIKIFSLLLYLKVLMPTARPKDPFKRRMKVKMTIYMITTALSQYNKGGDPEMVKWTAKQPERIYQMSVDGQPDMAGYLRVKAGKTKAGRGFYTRRHPFVHMRFNGVDGAMPVMLNEVSMVEAIRNQYLTVEGSPEYGRDIGDFMMRIQALTT